MRESTGRLQPSPARTGFVTDLKAPLFKCWIHQRKPLYWRGVVDTRSGT